MDGDRGPSRSTPFVAVEHLAIGFPDERGRWLRPVVHDATFVIHRDEIVGLVGESGSGKTQTALALLGLTRPPGRVLSGRIVVAAEEIVGMPERRLREIRGRTVAMIFQSPRTSLNPLRTAGDQLARVYRVHRGLDRGAARAAALRMLRRVGIAGAERVARSYPHQLSGGMAQRVMIGMMVACRPQLLIADEPTTGLDVTIQAQIFDLIQEVRRETGLAVLLITHDLGVVAEVCDRVVVMQAGRVVESAPVDDLYARPVHPYTRRLLAALAPAAATDEDGADTLEAAITSFAAAGRDYLAVAVDAWPALELSGPALIEIAPGHLVLGHAQDRPARATA
jgi:ABC-type dipeptide/oligopeptide/nickel transport system ATPase component